MSLDNCKPQCLHITFSHIYRLGYPATLSPEVSRNERGFTIFVNVIAFALPLSTMFFVTAVYYIKLPLQDKKYRQAKDLDITTKSYSKNN